MDVGIVELRIERSGGLSGANVWRCPVSQQGNVVCHVCNRNFSRECDKARHKCIVERSKPIQEQAGAVQCQLCDRWFRSREGLAVHRCREESEPAVDRLAVNPQVPVICGICGQQFRSSGGLNVTSVLNPRMMLFNA